MDTPPLLYKSVHVTFVFWVPKTPPPTPYMSGTFVLAPPPPPPPHRSIIQVCRLQTNITYLAKFIVDNRYYGDNFEKIIDYRDKKYCTDNGNPTLDRVNEMLAYSSCHRDFEHKHIM